MVTRAPLLRAGYGLRALAAVLLLAALWMTVGAASVAAQSGSLYFLTVKRGTTDATGSSETLFETLAPTHGTLQGSRAADTAAVELDIYGISHDSAGLGLGVEVLRYEQDWSLTGGEVVHMRTLGVLFTLKTYLRLGSVYPFLGLGMGNYYVNYSQATGNVSLRDSPNDVYTGRIGVRVLLGRLGLLWEAGRTRAQLPITTDVGRADLELGGTYSNLGLSWAF